MSAVLERCRRRSRLTPRLLQRRGPAGIRSLCTYRWQLAALSKLTTTGRQFVRAGIREEAPRARDHGCVASSPNEAEVLSELVAGLPHPTTPEEMVRELQSIGAERFKTSGFRLPPGTLERVRITIERTNEAVYSVQTSRARSKSKAEKGAAAALLGMRRGSVSSPSGSGGSTELPSPDASAGDGSARPLRSPSPIPMAPPLSLSSSSSSGPRMSLQNLLTSPSDAPAPPNRSDSWATLTRSRSRSPAPRMSAS